MKKTDAIAHSGQHYRVRVDAKRRPTLPPALLDAAEVGAGSDLVAHLDSPGRIVLTTPAAVLAELQAAVRAGADQHGELVEEVGRPVAGTSAHSPTGDEAGPADTPATDGADR